MSRVALVTASSAGLGAAIVKALAPTCRVVVNYNSRPAKAEEVISAAKALASDHDDETRFHAIQADVFDKPSLQNLVAETIRLFGRLDIVVSNHGWTRITNFTDFDDQTRESDWDVCFNANVKSHLWLFEAAKPFLEVAPDGGSFVAVASAAGVKPGGSSLAYSVTKAAQVHLVKGLATIAGPKVRCNSVSPGLLLTEWGLRFPQSKIDAVRNKAVGKDLARVEDVADAVRMLVESRSITGQNLVVDCGGVI